VIADVLTPGMATGIGSLPHSDPREAVDFVLRELPDLPAAPQLSASCPAEGMVAQAAAGIGGVRVEADGSLALIGQLDPGAPVVDALVGDGWEATRTFLDATAARRQPIKLQLTGPVTLGLALVAAGAPAVAAFQTAGAAVRSRARALVALAQARAPRAPLVVFIDEPGLTGLPARSFPIAPGEMVDLVSGILASLGPEVISGLHCCGMTDWRLALQAGPQVLSAPVDPSLADDGPALASFLEGGGWVAWGAVPTDRPVGDDPDVLWRQLVSLWNDLARTGCDPGLLRRQSLVTPACGLSGHGVSQAEWVLRLARQIGQRVQDQALASRLPTGT
jgi:hypothetical protein